jgi:succinate dehydrogenase hydrophobic anchor subunit
MCLGIIAAIYAGYLAREKNRSVVGWVLAVFLLGFLGWGLLVILYFLPLRE